MRDRSDRYQVQTVPNASSPSSKPRRLGSYLLEAGLVTPAQVHVALNDQQATGMRFGEVLVARGWVKEQTVEWIMQKVIVPERRASKEQGQGASSSATQSTTPTPKPEPTVPQPSRSSAATAQTNGKPIQTPKPEPTAPQPSRPTTATAQTNGKTPQSRRDVPISKPLPPVNSSDSDVSWVG